MAVFILLSRLGAESMEDARVRRVVGKEWLDKVNQACPGVKWLAHYAILGRYDFMDIFEAPDGETAQKVSLISRAEGAMHVETWQATPYADFLKLLEQVEP
ncbi:MAG: GYD domain-containing protein [Acidobacteria bacterium]|nr:GYD domain-containing protein [Acidobacteriota bacterium]